MNDVSEDWNINGMVLVDEAEASRVCNKHKENQRICNNRDKAVQIYAVRVVELSVEVMETRCDNAMLDEPINYLKRELKNVLFVERLNYVSLEVTSALVKALRA